APVGSPIAGSKILWPERGVHAPGKSALKRAEARAPFAASRRRTATVFIASLQKRGADRRGHRSKHARRARSLSTLLRSSRFVPVAKINRRADEHEHRAKGGVDHSGFAGGDGRPIVAHVVVNREPQVNHGEQD